MTPYVKKVIIQAYFQRDFNDTENNSRDILGNLDSMNVSLANVAKLAFFSNKYPAVTSGVRLLHSLIN